jgi:predicted ATPase/DNA-binding winged helix-turn-helix (wHTH) protein
MCAVTEADSRRTDAISFGAFRLSPAARLLEKGGGRVELGSRAMDILIVLTERGAEVVSNRELIARVWRGLKVEEGSLRFHVAALRKALGEGRAGARYITNVTGRGYCFVAPILRAVEKVSAAQVSDRPHPLPARLTRMVGRDEVIQSISTQLTAQRFVTIVGPGGIGKTTVAVSVSHALLGSFDGTIHFADLGPIIDPNLVPSTLASLLGLSVNSDDSVPGVLGFLRDKRMLLVFDSCEHVIDKVAPLAEEIFRNAPQVHILATSRESLRVEGEQVHRLLPLDCPPDVPGLTAIQATTFAAIRHFVERVSSSGHPFELTDSDAPTVAEICRRLDGIALAIELAASRVEAFGIAGTAALLNERFELLWHGRRTAQPRHQTLSAALDWSYDLLSDEERTALRRLCIFVGPFSLEAALSVAAQDLVHRAPTTDIIASLVAKSLVTVIVERSLVRYRLLDTTRGYVVEKLIDSGERDAVAHRHAHYYRALLDATDIEGTSESSSGETSLYREYMENVRAALEWCFSPSGNVETGAALAAAAAPLFVELSLLNECRVWSERSIAALDESGHDTRLELKLQAALGLSSMFTKGNIGDARSAFVRGLDLAERLHEKAFEVRLLGGLTLFHHRIGDHRGAHAFAERAQGLAQGAADSSGAAIASWMLCVSYHLVGNQDVACTFCKDALIRPSGSRDPAIPRFGRDHRVRALCAYARSLWLRGLPDQAVAAANLAIDEAVSLGNIITLCVSLIYAGSVFLWVRDLSRAESLIETLTSHAKKHSLHPYILEGRCMKAELCIMQGHAERGIDLLRGYMEAPVSERNQILSTVFATDLAEALAMVGNYPDALLTINEAIARFDDMSEWFHLPEMLRVKGLILGSKNETDPNEAEKWLRRSMATARQQSALSWELRASTTLAQLLRDRHRAPEAKALLAQVYGRFTEGFDTYDLQAAKTCLAGLSSASGAG